MWLFGLDAFINHSELGAKRTKRLLVNAFKLAKYCLKAFEVKFSVS